MGAVSLSSPAFKDEGGGRYLVKDVLLGTGTPGLKSGFMYLCVRERDKVCCLLTESITKNKNMIRLYGYDLQNWIQTSQITSIPPLLPPHHHHHLSPHVQNVFQYLLNLNLPLQHLVPN